MRCLLLFALFVGLCAADNKQTVRSLFELLSGGKGHLESSDLQGALCDNMYVGSARVQSDVIAPLDSDSDGRLSAAEFASAFEQSAQLGVVRQLHVALVNQTAIAVMWVTDDPLQQPRVTLLPSQRVFAANHSTYNAGLFGWHKNIYTAIVTDLQQGALYSYTAGGQQGTSAPVSFRMPMTYSSNTATVVVFGDQGTIQPLGVAIAKQVGRFCGVSYPTELKQQRAASPTPCDAVHVVGDLAYAWRSITLGPEEEWLWDLYQQEQQWYSASVPMMVTPGNHEGFDNQIAFRSRFRMPGPESGGNGNIWFSYNVGPIHFTSISTDNPYDVGSPQYQWLQQDLAAAAENATRARRPWIIVLTHRPMYSSDSFEYTQHIPGAPIQKTLEPLFVKYGVDLMVVGHSHTYERIAPLINGVPVVPVPNATVYRSPGAPAHVVQGTGGAFYTDKWTYPQPVWSAVRTAHYGIGVINANMTHLDYAYHVWKWEGTEKEINDRFYIVKQ